MGLQKIALNFMVKRGGNLVKSYFCVPKPKVFPQVACLKYVCNASDVVSIKKTPINAFIEYLNGYKNFGEAYIPDFEHSNPLFLEYFYYRKQVCVPHKFKIFGKEILQPAQPKIILGTDDADNYIFSLSKFLEFAKNDSKIITKEQFYDLVDEFASHMPAYVKKHYPSVRPEIADKADDICRWQYALGMEGKGTQKGEIIYDKFFDRQRKEAALKGYIQFVEELTGKKVLVGSPTRMGFSVSAVTLYNDPNVYKDVDYILLGHGTGSSLADVSSPHAWNFTDNKMSVWRFIEEKVPKGKRVLVTCCEEDVDYWKSLGRCPSEFTNTQLDMAIKRNFPEMLDKSGNYMYGVGNTVMSTFTKNHGVKICESGKRQIIGTRYIDTVSIDLEGFVSGAVGDFKSVDFDV